MSFTQNVCLPFFEAQELRAVVDAISPKKFQENVFRFFCPLPCFRVMSDEVVEKMLARWKAMQARRARAA